MDDPGRNLEQELPAAIAATVAGDVPTLSRLLERYPALARDHGSHRPLLDFAVREGRLESVQVLLAAGAEPSRRRSTATAWLEWRGIVDTKRSRAAGGRFRTRPTRHASRDRRRCIRFTRRPKRATWHTSVRCSKRTRRSSGAAIERAARRCTAQSSAARRGWWRCSSIEARISMPSMAPGSARRTGMRLRTFSRSTSRSGVDPVARSG